MFVSSDKHVFCATQLAGPSVGRAGAAGVLPQPTSSLGTARLGPGGGGPYCKRGLQRKVEPELM